jgi:hypothetical protein
VLLWLAMIVKLLSLITVIYVPLFLLLLIIDVHCTNPVNVVIRFLTHKKVKSVGCSLKILSIYKICETFDAYCIRCNRFCSDS